MGSLRDRYSNWVRNWDGVQGFKGEHSISARIGEHYCPYCNGALEVKTKKQIVNSESEEAKHFDFSSDGGRLQGNIEFRWDVYYCANCNIEIDIGDMRSYERELKKTGGNVDFDAIRERNKLPNKKKWPNLFHIFLVFLAFFLVVFIINLFNS